uniref:Thaicobrin-like n=1 Tax=Pelodiscus sinensis TaxID=13735 RepID=K7GCR5_PELSI|nr:thaicobrin-like [Pelodiscus sinensis]|eukprot:XP_006136027.1 thaicobrin-like [Pelodiscus sinensis]
MASSRAPRLLREELLERSELLKKCKADVTLDPDTANAWLFLSADGKSVKAGDHPQDVPPNPKRFELAPCVLGAEGFTSGRHYWEVEVGEQREWAVGVALESVKRNELLDLKPEEGIWSRGCWWLRRDADGASDVSSQGCVKSGKIGVCLDYEEGWVGFYEDDHTTMMQASFNNENAFPFLYLGHGVSLTLSP